MLSASLNKTFPSFLIIFFRLLFQTDRLARPSTVRTVCGRQNSGRSIEKPASVNTTQTHVLRCLVSKVTTENYMNCLNS